MGHEFIPLSVPNLKGRELEYVTKAVETEWVSTAGPYINEFENKLAEYVHASGAVSCQNGTAGLHIALMLCGVQATDAVLVPTLTFIAAVNPVKYMGAEPIFMDCDETLTLDPVKLAMFCEKECQFENGQLYHIETNKPIRAIVVVHVFGNMADMEAIIDIAEKYHLKIVEDATEALGTYYTAGRYKNCHAGTIGDVGVYSFNGNKIITTGGGGMIVSKHPEWLLRAKHLTTQAKSDELHYTHDEVGYNYRMTNIQAAIGLAQLEQLETFIQTKRDNYKLYEKNIDTIGGLTLLPFREAIRSNYWFYSIYVHSEFPMDRETLIQELGKLNVQTRPIWGLIHEQNPYLNATAYQIQKAKDYIDHVINVPCSTNLSSEEVMAVVADLATLANSNQQK